MLKTVIAFGLFFSAAAVATTRTRDHWHNYDDILAGCAVGMACATCAFLLNFGMKKSEEDEVNKSLQEPLRV